ncbi:hypothetical protein [Limnoglobus roseus]|uniref:Uncharacterized protein n=1 Tax=Limnoglobus roseus TaxID=2598579 RepID=A0A5C1ALB5_9BACT|nr:hypothetical protein [Limnoglobus roseus]QEL20199.1 hypothetical protein PX52LOC_07288 [Limnoglobus roseus]
MKRMWWGLLGVAILATTSGCRHTCGESKCKLFSRDTCDAPPARLTSATRDNAACSSPTTLGYPMSSGPSFPSSGPVYGPSYPSSGPSYPLPSSGIPAPGSSSMPDTIPPPFVPAMPMAVPPSSTKNILPPPLALSPPTSPVGFPR